MSSSPPPRALVVAHGDLAAGLVSAVEQIAGLGSRFAALSNRGLGPADLEATIVAHCLAGVRVVFTDLPAGSSTLAARRAQRAHPGLVVATGVNLAALLDFAFAAEDGEVGEAAQAAVEKGRLALQLPAAPGGAAGPATGGARAD